MVAEYICTHYHLSKQIREEPHPQWHDKAIRYLRGNSGHGWFGLYLYNLIRQSPNLNTVINIGTARGYSAFCARQALHDSKRDGVVHTIDVISPTERRRWQGGTDDPAQERQYSTKELLKEVTSEYPSDIKIKLHMGDSNTVLRSFSDVNPDLVFHDGRHTYTQVKTDYEMCNELASTNPVHVFHDCYLHEKISQRRLLDVRAFENYFETSKIGGLIRRLRQFTISKEHHPGVAEFYREAIEEYRYGELVEFPVEAAIGTIVPDEASLLMT
jgi:predicted O-methyltransferase YrrM